LQALLASMDEQCERLSDAPAHALPLALSLGRVSLGLGAVFFFGSRFLYSVVCVKLRPALVVGICIV
jgi:hypothetical protein